VQIEQNLKSWIESRMDEGGYVMSVVMNAVSTLRADGGVSVNSQEPNAALVDGARRCDPEAFEELVTIHGPRILRIAQKITGNREDAEEISQDSFARAFQHMGTFRGDSRFSTWLSRIAINQSLMKLRTRRWREVQFDRPADTEDIPFSVEIADNTPTPEQRYSQEELQRILGSAIDELPMTFREVLHLREVEEHSTEETARMLGLSISAVKSRVHRGRQMLRQTLTKYFRRSELASLPRRNSV
jgi:RNA polymerase sigma-70 factor, ECF subfamily